MSQKQAANKALERHNHHKQRRQSAAGPSIHEYQRQALHDSIPPVSDMEFCNHLFLLFFCLHVSEQFFFVSDIEIF